MAKVVTPEMVLERAEVFWGQKWLTKELAPGPGQQSRSRCRQAVMWGCRRYTTATLIEIGLLLQVDHSTVSYAVSSVERRMQVDDLEGRRLRRFDHELQTMQQEVEGGDG